MAASKTAFVFAGGGSLGAVQVGMLKALAAASVQPDVLLGSSVGAFNAAYVAHHPDRDSLTRLEAIWRAVRRGDVIPISPWQAFLGLFRHNYLVSAQGLEKLAWRHFGQSLLEDAPVECHLTATDLLDGSRVLLSSGLTVEALLASTAIPAVFPPLRQGNRLLIDGGVASNSPIGSSIECGADRGIVLPTGISCARQPSEMPANALEMAMHSLNLLITRQLVADAEVFRNRARITIVPPLCPLDVSIFSFEKTGELIERGEQQTLEWIDRGGLESTVVPEAIRPHRH